MAAGQVVAQGEAGAVLQPERLQQVYQVAFRKLTVEGHQILTTLTE